MRKRHFSFCYILNLVHEYVILHCVTKTDVLFYGLWFLEGDFSHDDMVKAIIFNNLYKTKGIDF